MVLTYEELSMSIAHQITELKQKVEYAITQFSNGCPILIGDDGKRENEVDLVFHGSFATKELVNLAITHAKGLLCVALDHAIADKLGFYTAPRFPGGISHTNFTLSVDAKNNITSGISAGDRAHTIKLMSSPSATSSDFITPGHVFPLRAVDGGLTARAGHTEALYELCQFSNLPSAAAMCEVLGENGEPISPHDIQEHPVFAKFPFITTIDLLWYKILYKQQQTPIHRILNENKYIIPENVINLSCAIQFYKPKFSAENIRIVLNNGFSILDNGISQNNCCAEIVLFSFEDLLSELPSQLSDFCDLSAKVGLKNTCTSVKRLVSLINAFKFIEQKMEIKLTAEFVNAIKFPVKNDNILKFSL